MFPVRRPALLGRTATTSSFGLPARVARLAVIVAALTMALFAAPAFGQTQGSLDPSFQQPPFDVSTTAWVTSIAAPGTQVIVGGDFAYGNGQSYALARLNAGGSIDGSFVSPLLSGSYVNTVVVQPDGKILVGGSALNLVGGRTRNIIRLNADGSEDGSFNCLTITNSVRAIALYPDGTILVGGNNAEVVRLTSTGARDATFTSPGLYGINTIAIVGNDFVVGASGQGFTPVRLARFAYDGTRDLTFPNADRDVRTLLLEPSGSIIVGGTFDAIGSTNQSYLARVNADGTVSNASFLRPNLGWVISVARQSDGKIVAVGKGIAQRYNADGTTDTTFSAPQTTDPTGNNELLAVRVLPSGSILIGGGFQGFTVGGQTVARTAIAQLIGAPPAPATAPTGVTAEGGDRQATVSWASLSGDITAYVATSSPQGKTCRVTAPDTACIVTGLTAGTSYTFTVRAVNDAGDGPESDPSNAVTPTGAASGGSSGDTPAPSTGGGPASTSGQASSARPGAEGFGVTVPDSLAKSGLPVSAEGTVGLPLQCPIGVAGFCDASGALSLSLPASVQAERGKREQASRVRVLARFKGVDIAAGRKRLYTVRLAPATYSALRRAGARRVPATLRIVNRVGGGNPVVTRERVWLKILPMKVAVTG